MADETAPAAATQAAEKIEKAPAEATAPSPAETKAATPEPEPKVEETKRPARKATASKVIKAAPPAAKPAPAAKAKPVRKPAARKQQTRPARAGAMRNIGVETMTKQTNGIDTGLFAAEQFKTVFGDVNERAKVAVERSAKIVEELADLTRGNVEAFVASSKVAAKGVEALGQDAAEYGRKSFEEASAAFKGLAEAKSATDFFKLQGDYARATFDAAVAESARLSETVLKLAGEVAEPLTSRYNVAAERVKTLAA